jgi:hypothetical protein
VSGAFAPTLKGGGGIAIFLPYFILAKNKINPMTFFALSFFKVCPHFQLWLGASPTLRSPHFPFIYRYNGIDV